LIVVIRAEGAKAHRKGRKFGSKPHWAMTRGATTFTTLTVAANGPAGALFGGLGMRAGTGYHYRKAAPLQEVP
jgi:hypothetical protein